MNMKWVRGKPIFIILLFAVLVLFLSVVIILAGQQSSYLKTSSTGGIPHPDDFLKECLAMVDSDYDSCMNFAEETYNTCVGSWLAAEPTPFDDHNSAGWIAWEKACTDSYTVDMDGCAATFNAGNEECERIADGLRGTPTPDPTPTENPIE